MLKAFYGFSVILRTKPNTSLQLTRPCRISPPQFPILICLYQPSRSSCSRCRGLWSLISQAYLCLRAFALAVLSTFHLPTHTWFSLRSPPQRALPNFSHSITVFYCLPHLNVSATLAEMFFLFSLLCPWCSEQCLEHSQCSIKELSVSQRDWTSPVSLLPQ